MNNLFNPVHYQQIQDRIAALKPDSERQWGKMNPAQMLAHCANAFEIPVSGVPQKRMFAGYLFGWLVKKSFYNEKPWRKNIPTAPSLLIKDDRNFEQEKTRLQSLVQKFTQLGPEKISEVNHPFFGRMTAEQWGNGMYKHLDHHLQQFGV
jgi:hypothetical protein